MRKQEIRAKVLIAGKGEGRVLKLAQPISFWGGVDPESGCISDPRHPQYGAPIGGCIFVLAGTIGSSSSSAVMLELIARGKAPAAIILDQTDAILALGVVVAREMGHISLPILQLPRQQQKQLTDGAYLAVGEDGALTSVGSDRVR